MSYGTLPLLGGESVVYAIGDSITDNGSNYGYPSVSSSNSAFVFDGRKYLEWAHMLSGGKIRNQGWGAHGGYTSTQILNTYVPQAIAARPGACIVLAGTNNITTCRPDLLNIWTQLAQAGVLPICCTLTPRQAGTVGLTALNAWIARQARLNGWPLVDLYAATVDPTSTNVDGNWLSGYNGDAVHPAIPGAKAMGQAIANALASIIPEYDQLAPPLPMQNGWLGLANGGQSNALLLNSTSGVPNDWSVDSGSSFSTSVSAMGANEGIGNWFNITRGGTDGGYRTTGTIAVVPGNKMAVGFRFKTSGLAASGGKLDIRLSDTSVANMIYQLCSPGLSGVDVALGTVYHEIVVPANFGTSAKFSVSLTGGNFTVSIGQICIVDLTAQGAA